MHVEVSGLRKNFLREDDIKLPKNLGFFFFPLFSVLLKQHLVQLLQQQCSCLYVLSNFASVQRAAQHVQISSKNGDREIRREERRKIITALGWLSQLEDLTLARLNHNMYNLKWHIAYPAVLKQLLLKITSVEFLSFIEVQLRTRYAWESLIVVLPIYRVALLCSGDAEALVWDGNAIQTAWGLLSHPPHSFCTCWQANSKPGRWRCP